MSCNSFAIDYPTKDVRLVVPFAKGESADFIARTLANNTELPFGKSISIMNRTGKAGAVGINYGVNRRPDGYTLTIVTREVIALPLIGLMQNKVNDFKLIRMFNLEPAIIIVPTDSPFNSIHDLLSQARKSPEKIKFASTTSSNFYLMALAKHQGIKLNTITYNNSTEAIPSILSHHTQATIITLDEGITQLRSGQFRSLGVMSEERISYISNIPTLIEQGLNISTGTWRGIGVPKDTPDQVIEILGNAFDKAILTSEFKKQMYDKGMTIYSLTSQEFTDFVKKDELQLTQLIN